MKRTHRLLFAAATACVLAGVARAQSPDAWIKGLANDGYEMGVDLPGPTESGPAAVYLKSVTPRPANFSALRQSMSAEMYRTARVRMSASVKAEGVTGSAGLWMRVDGVKASGAEMARLLAFDNMCNRPILGSSDWKTYAIVLDVPKDALQIVYGILLSPRGPQTKTSGESIGEVWIKNVHFEIVDKKVKTTAGREYSCPEWSRPR